MKRPRLLVVSRHSPMPEFDGAGAYLFDLLRYLASTGVEIEVVWLETPGKWLEQGYCVVPDHVRRVFNLQLPGPLALGPWRFFWWGPIKARFLHHVKSALKALGLWRQTSGAPAQVPRRQQAGAAVEETGGDFAAPQKVTWSSLPTTSDLRFIRARGRRFQPTSILAMYCWMSPVFDLFPGIQSSVLTCDVVSHLLPIFNPDALKLPGPWNPATPQGEKALLSKSDTVLAISEYDAAIFRQMVPEKAVLLTPKAAVPVAPSTVPSVVGRCLFVGGVNEPNREGIEWFLTKVWSAILESVPEAVLHICGGIGAEISVPMPPSVVLRGRVEDLSSEYHQAQVVLVPLLNGTGVKIKLVEAASFGKACVTTPVGLQGLPFLQDSLFCAERPEEFARGVVAFLQQPLLRQELESRIRSEVEKHLSADACYGGYQRLLAASGGA